MLHLNSTKTECHILTIQRGLYTFVFFTTSLILRPITLPADILAPASKAQTRMAVSKPRFRRKCKSNSDSLIQQARPGAFHLTWSKGGAVALGASSYT